MAKNAVKIILFSIFLAFFSSCDISPTYSRKNIESVIANICKKEFNLDVRVWAIGDTVWIYIPLEDMIAKDNQLDKSVLEKLRLINLSLERTILSMDKPPKFYSFVVSDIKNGIDVYSVGFIPDMIKARIDLISRNDLAERGVFLVFNNAKALGDTQGEHVIKYDMSIGEFISYLIKQDLEKKFAAADLKDYVKVNEIRTKYYKGKMEIDFDIMIKKYKEKLPYPFDEAFAITKKLFSAYGYPPDITEITIRDVFNKKSRSYTRTALMAEK
ncbi:MAG: hypothetical protein PHP17_04095 [Candidatus Omnitrophica bacterium]|nr:hypothetical protein [Candidatus Omnitrophota bacterium]